MPAHSSQGGGVGEGRTGESYALPTKGHGIVDMPLAQIEVHIVRFLEHARINHDTAFALTPVGCGLAGHTRRDIWGILKKHGLPRNVYLTSTWVTDDTS